MRRLVIYYSFVIVSIMTLTGFLGAKSIPQLISAVFFFPLFLYFAKLVVPKRNKAIIIPAKTVKKAMPTKAVRLKKISPGQIDIDRRMFLKLIGSAGLSVFFLALFTRKAQAAFFGSVPGPGTVALKDTAGVQIDPAIKTPTDGYKISQLDDATPAFYGFVNKDSAWFIMKEDSSGNYRYAKGSSAFATNWTNRASLIYDYFDAIF